MAVTWNIGSLDTTVTVGSLSNVVKTVHWNATDQELVDSIQHSGYVNGCIDLAAPESSSFIAYDSLTQDTVIGWVKASLGTDKVTEIENKISAQITESKTPTEISGVPW
tara:strand:+ start:467 stop:793 length:327 start_codon:yes stop_codon:yes gene_type:complete